MDLKLKGRVALVTGGSRGIGRATVRALAAEGCRLAICARGVKGLDAIRDELQASDVDFFSAAADVTEPTQVADFVDGAAQALGGIDVLVNNVGGRVGGDLLASSWEDWRKTFDLNLFHSVEATRRAVPHMRQRGGGSVITVASISGWKPAPEVSQYGATKAAEIFLAGALSWELAPHNIRVNTVSPGSILFRGGGWEIFREREPERFRQFVERELPAGRLGTAEEVADVVCFLASPRANWVNGTAIAVDGAQGRPSAF
ncbi:MAG: SDR family oxidoreductase [Candidatus Latescibacterota bacterium]|nr:SDR family oxidoreductase [Candidatus Latescibacterota bacterium]